ncbi:unnamed protein product [Phyllotreta striolata]|uniref:Dynein axonemal assembly factor 1 homolog n=1 Tax=Phyllotreta striolata TaxID=444603 RepID=A0A9N9TVC1_PHYSR|nr:unnamed protein product [Phyllotreta striolata]
MNSDSKIKLYDSMLNYVCMHSEGTLYGPHTSKSTQTQCLDEESIDSLPQEMEVDEEVKHSFDIEMISGLWGLHRFEKNQWSAQVRPVTRLKHFEKLKLTEKEKAGQLSRRMIACCLTYLERSPYDCKIALCKCQLPDKGIKDISALRSYHYLQYLNLSRNQITTLEALSDMPFLQYLDASNNYIENAFDFEAPLYLTTVNYSKNRIKKIPVLDRFWSIVNLDMSYNCIREIRGLQNLKFLVNLNLSYNRITFLENLSNLKLAKLNLSHNSISMVETEDRGTGFNTLSSLHVLDLSHNKLPTCNFLQGNEWLEELYLNDNNINDLLEVYYFRYMTDLRILDLSNNKLCDNYHFKAICIRTLQKLCVLNKQAILPEDRIETATKEKINQLIPAHTAKVQLMLLEYLTKPKIGAHVCPYGENIPSIIVILGPPASRKKFIVNKYIQHCDFLKLGMSYTTRPKKKYEVEGKDYYFIGKDKFVAMIRKADFITVSEFNGHLYGIHYSELEKSIDSILVFYTDLETALILKMAGLHPKLILAMPRSETTHIKWIKETYFFDEKVESIVPEIKIQTCPASLKDVRVEIESEEPSIDEDGESDEIDQILAELSKQKIYEHIKGTNAYTQREIMFKRKQSMLSEKIDIDFGSTISSEKRRPSRLTDKELKHSKHSQSNELIALENVLNWKNYEDTTEDDDAYRKEMGLDDYLRRLSEDSTLSSVAGTEQPSQRASERKSQPFSDGFTLPEHEDEIIPRLLLSLDDPTMAYNPATPSARDPATASARDSARDPTVAYNADPATASIRYSGKASIRDSAAASIQYPATPYNADPAMARNVHPATASIRYPGPASVRDSATASIQYPTMASIRDPATGSIRDSNAYNVDPATASIRYPGADSIRDSATASIQYPTMTYSIDTNTAYNIDPATASIRYPGPASMRDSVTASIRDPATPLLLDPARTVIVDPATVSIRDPATPLLADPARTVIVDPATVSIRDPATPLLVDPARTFIADPATVSVVISPKSEFRDSSEHVESTSEVSLDTTLDEATMDNRNTEPSISRKVSFPDRELAESEAAPEEVRSYDSVEPEERGREHAKSVSNTHILRAMHYRVFDNPMLSALSASDLTKEETKKIGSLLAKTTYMTLAERFDAFKADKLGPFVARILLQRKELLNLHFENPGLFQTVIFTDDKPSVCIDVLKDLTKQEVQSRNLNKIQIDILEDNPKFKDYIHKKILQLKLFKNRTNSQHEDLHLM